MRSGRPGSCKAAGLIYIMNGVGSHSELPEWCSNIHVLVLKASFIEIFQIFSIGNIFILSDFTFFKQFILARTASYRPHKYRSQS